MVSENQQNPQLIYSIMKTSDVEDVARLLVNAFRERPLQQATGVTEQELFELMRYTCSRVVEEGLSIIARDSSNNKVVACRLTEQHLETKVSLVPKPNEAILQKYNRLTSFNRELTKPIIAEANNCPGKKAHGIFLAVDSTYRGQGLAKMIFAIELLFLKRLGYTWFFGEFNNPHSRQATLSILSNPYHLVNVLTFSEFKYENDFPFARVAGEGTAALFNVDLKPNYQVIAEQELQKMEIMANKQSYSDNYRLFGQPTTPENSQSAPTETPSAPIQSSFIG